MKIIVVPADGLVGVDGVFRKVNLGSLIGVVNALRYNTASGNGTVERIVSETLAVEEPITDFAPYQWTHDLWVQAGVAPVPTVNQRKAQRRVEFNRLRENTFAAGLTHAGNSFDTDPVSVVKINGAVTMALISIVMSQPFSISWTTSDDSTVTFDATGMIQLGMAVGQYADQLHQRTRIAKDALKTATTLAEVDAVVW